MSDSHCYLDEAGCLVCPEVQATPARAEQYINAAVLGWNAGANSIDQLAGDVHAVFSFDSIPVGVAIGFKTARVPQDNPNLIEHGVYVYGAAGSAILSVIEAGKTLKTVGYTVGADIEIRRLGTQITYLVGGDSVYESDTPSYGALLVNACLYASGDTVP